MNNEERMKIEKNKGEWAKLAACYLVGAFVFLAFSCLAGAIGIVMAIIAYAGGFILVGIWSEVQTIRYIMELERLEKK